MLAFGRGVRMVNLVWFAIMLFVSICILELTLVFW